MPILTDKIIRDLKPEDGRSEHHIWDVQLLGFGVRIRATGHKTYVFYCRPHNRKRMRKLTIGRADAIPAKEARRIAREYLGEIAAGKGDALGPAAEDRDPWFARDPRAQGYKYRPANLPWVLRMRRGWQVL